MKQNSAKNFFKEHRFIFQEPRKESGPTAPTIAPTTTPPTAPPATQAGEKPADPNAPPDGKPGSTTDKPTPTPGANPEAAKPEAPKAPEVPAAAKAAGEGQIEGTGTVKRAAVIDRVKFNELLKTDMKEFFALTRVLSKTFPLRDSIAALAEKDLATMTQKMITELKPVIAENIKGKENDLEKYLNTLGGTKEEFIEAAAAMGSASFKTAMENLLASQDYRHLQKFAEKPENKDKILIYTPRFSEIGVAIEIKLGPEDLLTAYNTFHTEQENLKTSAQKAADALKVGDDLKERTKKITTLKSYPILKFLSPFLGLDTIDAATGKSGWECVADGTHTIAMFALDLCGYEDGKGSIESIASFLPGQTGAKIKAAQKTFSAESNSLSHAAWQKKTGGQPGAPAAPGAPQAPNAPSKPVKPGEVPTTNQEKVDMTKFGDIIAKPGTMPKSGIVFENAVRTDTGGIPQIIKIDLNQGGRLILPGNSGSDNELKIDGEKVVVPPGETRTFNSNSGKYNNGILTLEGLINAGTVIDGIVKIKNAALDTPK